MIFRKRVNLFVAFLVLMVNSVVQCQSPQSFSSPSSTATFLLTGEELTYEVSWWLLKLGTIRFKVIQETELNNEKLYTAIGYIDSYSGIPFVNLHTVFLTEMDSEGYSRSSKAWDQLHDKWDYTHYIFDRENSLLIIKQGIADTALGEPIKIKSIDSIALSKKGSDGLSILYFARAHVNSGKKFSVPTIVNYKEGTTSLNFYRKRTDVKIGAVDYPVDVLEFDGYAYFQGIFGLSGPFMGWFSNDSAHIPIKATLNVMLGSISVELIKWERNGWNPPASKSQKAPKK
jgi:hypothetical protein